MALANVATPKDRVPHWVEARLDEWLRWHSLGMVPVVGAAALLEAPAVLAGYAALSFAVMVYAFRGRWTDAGRFGAANLVTTFRLGLTLALLTFWGGRTPLQLALVGVLVLVLDGVDGWLARRRQLSSAFGALYDVEVDSILVCTLPLLLVQCGRVGPWIVLVGLWHYLYVLMPLLVPTPLGRAPRSRFGRTIYALMISSFLLALVVPARLAPGLALFGLVIVSASFVRSFWQRYATAARR